MTIEQFQQHHIQDIYRLRRWIEAVLAPDDEERTAWEGFDPTMDDLMVDIKTVAWILGNKIAGSYKKSQPNLTVEELRPDVIMVDGMKDAKELCLDCGIMESNYFMFFGEWFKLQLIEGVIRAYIGDEEMNERLNREFNGMYVKLTLANFLTQGGDD